MAAFKARLMLGPFCVNSACSWTKDVDEGTVSISER